MGRIYFDTDELKNLDSDLNTIDSALVNMMEKVKNFDVPSVWYDWFSYRSFLDDGYCYVVDSNLYKGIKKGKQYCEDIDEWVNDCKVNLETFSEGLVSAFKDVEEIELKPRGSIVILK